MGNLSLRNAPPINGGSLRNEAKAGVFRKGDDGGFIWTLNGNGRGTAVVPQPMVMKKIGGDYLPFPVNGEGMPKFASVNPMPESIRLKTTANETV